MIKEWWIRFMILLSRIHISVFQNIYIQYSYYNISLHNYTFNSEFMDLSKEFSEICLFNYGLLHWFDLKLHKDIVRYPVIEVIIPEILFLYQD